VIRAGTAPPALASGQVPPLLLLQVVISTPDIAAACGRQMCVVGPLDVIPEILEFVALLVLLYLSSE